MWSACRALSDPHVLVACHAPRHLAATENTNTWPPPYRPTITHRRPTLSGISLAIAARRNFARISASLSSGDALRLQGPLRKKKRFFKVKKRSGPPLARVDQGRVDHCGCRDIYIGGGSGSLPQGGPGSYEAGRRSAISRNPRRPWTVARA